MAARAPRNLNLALKRIDQLENENEALSDALHKISNECAVMLSNKDKAMIEKCKTCKRGLGSVIR